MKKKRRPFWYNGRYYVTRLASMVGQLRVLHTRHECAQYYDLEKLMLYSNGSQTFLAATPYKLLRQSGDPLPQQQRISVNPYEAFRCLRVSACLSMYVCMCMYA